MLCLRSFRDGETGVKRYPINKGSLHLHKYIESRERLQIR
jgi:hypothetical protein